MREGRIRRWRITDEEGRRGESYELGIKEVNKK